MSLGTQVVWLVLLGLPIASVAWTVTHEEIFREPREYCADRSQNSDSLLCRKVFYIFTCEYCFSHYVTAFFLIVTRYKLLFDDWRGYLLAFFALPYVANFYMGLYAQTKLEATKDRYGAKALKHEAELREIEKEQRKEERERIIPAA